MRLVFSNAGVVRNINIRSTVTLKKDILVSCGKVTNHNVSINSNVHRCINVCYLNEFLGSVLVNKSVVSNSNVLANRSATASHKRNLTERNSDRSTFAAKTPVCKSVISDGKRICVCDICRTLFYSDRIVLSIANLIIIDKKCKSVTNSDTYFCAVNNVAGDSSKDSVSVGNNVNRILINVIELTIKNTCILKVDKSKTLTLEYDTLNGYRTVVGYSIIITDVETTGKSSAVICSALDSDALATESVNVIGNLDLLCNSTCKKLNYIAVNRSIDSLGNGLVSCSADLCYCNKSRNVRINVRITTVCTCVSCITVCVESRRSYNRIVVVTKSRNLICNVAVTTVTGVGCVTCSLTGRSGYNCVVRVTCSRNYYLSYLIVTSCTVRAFGKTEFGTGRINCSIGNHIVTECINLVCNVAFATYTGVGCVTAVYTVGSSYSCIIVMNVKSNTKCAVLVCLTVEAVCTVIRNIIRECTVIDEAYNNLNSLDALGYALNSHIVYRYKLTTGNGNRSDSIIFILANVFNYDCRTGCGSTACSKYVILLFTVTDECTTVDLKRSGLEVNCSISSEVTVIDSQLTVSGPINATDECTVVDGQISIVVSIRSVRRYA